MNILTKCKLIVKEKKIHGTVPLTVSDINQFYHIFSTYCSAVHLVYKSFSQFLSQLKLYSQFQLNLQRDPIALGVPISTSDDAR